jgi:hypothetical protein
MGDRGKKNIRSKERCGRKRRSNRKGRKCDEWEEDGDESEKKT